MSAHEWAPGDVAMVRSRTIGGIPNAEKVMFRVGAGIPLGARTEDGPVWMLHHGGHVTDDNAETVRPLVVIDPEDREQVKRFAAAYVQTFAAGSHLDPIAVTKCADQMQAALREFAQPVPVKPDEPTGLGAVVELVDGRCAVRTFQPVQPWSHFMGGLPFLDCWSELDVVKILSEGVQP